MKFVIVIFFSQMVFAANTPENCLRNFGLGLDPDAPRTFKEMAAAQANSAKPRQTAAVGDSVVITNPDGSLSVYRPKGTVTIGADGVRCNGTGNAEKGQGLYGLLTKIMLQRGSSGNSQTKTLLAKAVKECWNLSPELNAAIMEVSEEQQIRHPAEANAFPAGSSR